jgi:hypothetical protein
MSLWTDKIKPFLARISPFGNALPVQIVLYVMVGLFFAAMVTHCGKAKGAELDILTGSTVVRGYSGVIGMNVRYPRLVANYADLSVGFDIIGQSTWCSGGRTGPQCFNNNQAAVHAQVIAPLKYNFELGIGVAKLQHVDNYNSGPINFSLSLQHTVWKSKIPQLYWRYQHFSCAGTCSPNTGRDILLLGWRFK